MLYDIIHVGLLYCYFWHRLLTIYKLVAIYKVETYKIRCPIG